MDSRQDQQYDAVCHAAMTVGRSSPGVDVGAIEIIVTFLRAQFRLARSMDEHFRRYGLTSAKFDLLLVLHKAPGQQLTMWEIGEQLGVTRTNVTGLVDGLERESLVRRLIHPTDRRSVLVELLPEGEELLHRVVPDAWRWMSDRLAGFSLDERVELLRLLRKLQAALGARF